MTDPLAEIRAEVEQLREECKRWLRAPYADARVVTAARRQAFKEVLDLIDKQREGQ